MNNDDKYQGWANRETWALMLWVNNDPGLYETFRDTLREFPQGSTYSATEEHHLSNLADTLFTPDGYNQEYGDDWPEGLQAVASEIGSLWRVDWAEVVSALKED